MSASAERYSKMAASMDEKTGFWVSRIPGPVHVLDFGCANGALRRHLMRTSPWVLDGYTGYDHKLPITADFRQPEATFVSALGAFILAGREARLAGKTTVLVLSSVIHELISVSGMSMAGVVDGVIRRVDADYVVIRDMAAESWAYRSEVYVKEISAAIRDSYSDRDAAATYERMLAGNKKATLADMLHVLLKYPHWANIEEEVEESYLPVSAEGMLNHLVVGSGYSLTYYEHAPFSYMQDRWLEDLGILIPFPTHVKIIMKRRW